jgi:hypothetical protein
MEPIPGLLKPFTNSGYDCGGNDMDLRITFPAVSVLKIIRITFFGNLQYTIHISANASEVAKYHRN